MILLIIGHRAGPHPLPPNWCATFQCVIGRESRAQCLAQYGKLRLTRMLACVALAAPMPSGLFHPFSEGLPVCHVTGVKAGGRGLEKTVQHAAPLGRRAARCCCTATGGTYLMEDDAGQIIEDATRVRPGWGLPAASARNISWLQDLGRVTFTSMPPIEEALTAFR